MRLFLDANVLFTAAHNPHGRSSALFDLARSGVCWLSTSPHGAEEARRNIRVKFPEASGRLETLQTLLQVEPEATPDGVAWALAQGVPEKDAPIL
ncbi:MAG: DNA-binding protein, partial [Acidobacteria bacterium]|nr:DNA-binding protein [Acidobacteriota bacterium]